MNKNENSFEVKTFLMRSIGTSHVIYCTLRELARPIFKRTKTHSWDKKHNPHRHLVTTNILLIFCRLQRAFLRKYFERTLEPPLTAYHALYKASPTLRTIFA